MNISLTRSIAAFTHVVFASWASAQTTSASGPSVDPVERLEKRFAAEKAGRYMEQMCRDSTYDGWTGYPVQVCDYTVRDKKLGPISARVVLLDPTPSQLARWTVSACIEVRGTADAECTAAVLDRIISQSNAQFPVAGLVLEDQHVAGNYEVYPFRDGVTVRVDGITNMRQVIPTATMNEIALSAPPKATGLYARVAGTTREEYAAICPDADVTGLAWRRVVRQAYQSAWRSDRNPLLVAWLRAHTLPERVQPAVRC